MKQINIIKNGQITNQAQFDTQEESNQWLEKHLAMESFGKAAYSYEREISPAVLDENGEEILSAQYETVNVPAEYEIQVEEIQDNSVQEKANEQARKYLADTDWYIIRFMETGISVPSEISESRQSARNSIV